MSDREPQAWIEGLGQGIVALLALQIVMLLAEIAALLHRIDLWHQLQAGGFVSQSQAHTADTLVAGAAGIGGIAFVCTVVLWLVWQHRAQTNAVELAGGGLRFTPGWAVGWWLVPFANLVKPFQTVRELWKASHGPGWQTVARWRLLGWWWALWIAGWLTVWFGPNGVQIGIGTSASTQTASLADTVTRDHWGVFWLGARALAALLAIMIVRSVGRLQTRAIAVRAMVAVPPPPSLPDASGAPAVPPPPVTTQPVTDALSPGERAWIMGGVIAVIVLTVAGTIWSGRTHAAVAGPPGVPGASLPGEATQSYARNGVRFERPADWSVGTSTSGGQVGSAPEWNNAFAPPDTQPVEVVIVSGYNLTRDASTASSDQLSATVGQVASQLAQQIGGTVGTDVVTVPFGAAGTGYQVSMTGTVQGTPLAIQLNVLFDGMHEYTVVCQYMEGSQAEIARGCEMIRTTFEVDGSG